MRICTATIMIALVSTCAAGIATASNVVHSQGFETDTAAWSTPTNYGAIQRVSSGTGVTSATGAYHAVVSQLNPLLEGPLTSQDNPNTGYGPYSFFDGARSVWPGGMTASIDIYLDTAMNTGEGFDYSVAANGSDGNHQRDFIFHVAKDTSTGSLLIGANNNSNFDPIENLESGNHYAVTSSGWYTFQHVFYEAVDGTLSVDLKVLDTGGNELFSETRNNSTDVIATEIGGNRYSWFSNIDVTGGVAIDNHSLSIVPEPSSLALLSLASLGMLRRRRQR